MKMTLIAAAALVSALAIPAFAADTFYLVRDTETKRCSIVEVQPTMRTMKVIGTVHKTKANAEAAMKANKDCILI
jgi:hypothetical protein